MCLSEKLKQIIIQYVNSLEGKEKQASERLYNVQIMRYKKEILSYNDLSDEITGLL